MRRLFRDRRGVSAVEYALLLFAILLVAAGGYRALGRGNTKAASTTTKVLLGGEADVVGAGGRPSSGGGRPSSGGGRPSGDDAIVCDGRSCGSPGNCFVAGTPVWTPRGELAIEAIAEGDVVLSRDEQTGEVRGQRVVHTFAHRAASLVDVVLTRGDGDAETLHVTPEHRFWTGDRGWVEAQTLTGSEPLVDLTGDAVRVASVTTVAANAMVYNFEVEATHTYFVGHLATWVHNACGDPIKPVFGGLSGASIPSVSAQTVSNALGTGALPPNGVGTFSINPQTGAIGLAPPPSAPGPGTWVSSLIGGGGPTTFSGQYIGLSTPTPTGTSAAHPVDPTANVVFTDNLTGCTVVITHDSPPKLLHLLASDLGDTPAAYQAAINPAMVANGINPQGDAATQGLPPIVVTADQYGWQIGGGDYGTGHDGQHNSQAFVYGVNEGSGDRQWWLLTVGHGANGVGYVQSAQPLGATRP